MGSAVTIGLGLAQAQPDVPVAVITGDGEMLMGLGGLATCAIRAPSNLSVVVLDNGHYGETGMQLSHTGGGLELHAVAASMGFGQSDLVASMSEVDALASRLHQPQNLNFACVKVSSAPVERCLPSRDGVRNKLRFREALGLSLAV